VRLWLEFFAAGVLGLVMGTKHLLKAHPGSPVLSAGGGTAILLPCRLPAGAAVRFALTAWMPLVTAGVVSAFGFARAAAMAPRIRALAAAALVAAVVVRSR
jgi:hypothetical protein